MKKIFVIFIIALSVAACSSKVTPTGYRLPEANPVEYRANGSTGQIYLAPVTLTDMLGGRGIVYQINEVEYSVAKNNLWIEPLSVQLQESMSAHLRRLMPEKVILTTNKMSDATRINIALTAFNGRYDGKAVVRGVFYIINPAGLHTVRAFNYELEQTEDGYSALVDALGGAWARLAGDIAAELKQPY